MSLPVPLEMACWGRPHWDASPFLHDSWGVALLGPREAWAQTRWLHALS